MATIAKENKKFRWWLFLIFFISGTFRCIYDLAFFPKHLNWGAGISPRPQVFIDKHYFFEKLIEVKYKSGKIQSFNLTNEEQWPLKHELLIFQYTLVHSLDRPQLVDEVIWEKVIRFHFCNEDFSKSAVKPEILANKVIGVKALIRKDPFEPFSLIREAKCFN